MDFTRFYVHHIFWIPTILLQKITVTHLRRYRIIQLALVFIKLHRRNLIVYDQLNIYDYGYCWFRSLHHYNSSTLKGNEEITNLIIVLLK
jgi:hypothetical protein